MQQRFHLLPVRGNFQATSVDVALMVSDLLATIRKCQDVGLVLQEALVELDLCKPCTCRLRQTRVELRIALGAGQLQLGVGELTRSIRWQERDVSQLLKFDLAFS